MRAIIETKIVQKDPDGTPCFFCDEPIYGIMYDIQVFNKKTGEKLETSPQTKFCECCANEFPSKKFL